MSYLFLLPIVAFALCQSTFLSTSIAVILHKNITWPYISEGGTFSPESCVFSMLTNVTSILLGIIIYIRFRQIERLLYHHVSLLNPVAKRNAVALWFGLAACFGLSMVANFQLTKLPQVHYIGAFSCFGLGTVYFWIQGFISYSVRSYSGSKQMAYGRFVMAAISTCTFCAAVFTSCKSTEIIFDEEHPVSCRYKNISAIAEWIIATTFCIFILSFTSEFKAVIIERPVVTVIRNECRSDSRSSSTSSQNSLVYS